MHNSFIRNVGVCPQRHVHNNCRQSGTDNAHADDLNQSGIWALSVTNNFIENRMANHEHGLFTQTTAFTRGRGEATNRVCTMNAPLGTFRGNVQHSNARFGFYLDSNFPRQIDRSVSSNGYLPLDEFGNTDFSSCEALKADGSDNGASAVIEDNLDIANIFSGQYAATDIQYLRWHNINGMLGMYWKQTKPFADPSFTAHVKDSIIEYYGGGHGSLASEDDRKIAELLGMPVIAVVHMAGPGGIGQFVLENVTFIGPAFRAIGMNHHCDLGGTGMLCTPTYQLINVNFDGLRPVYPNEPDMQLFSFGHSDGETTLPAISSLDGSLPFISMASSAMTHLLSLPGSVCRQTNQNKYDNAIACDVPLRRLQIWSDRQSKMRLFGPGNAVHDLKYIDNQFAERKRAYGVQVAVGYSYRLEMSHGDVTIEFSDLFFGTKYDFPVDTLDLVVAVDGQPDRNCGTITSQHDRKFIDLEYGPTWKKSRSEMGACRSSINSARSTNHCAESEVVGPCRVDCGDDFVATLMAEIFTNDPDKVGFVNVLNLIVEVVDKHMEEYNSIQTLHSETDQSDDSCLSLCGALEKLVFGNVTSLAEAVQAYCKDTLEERVDDVVTAKRSSSMLSTRTRISNGSPSMRQISTASRDSLSIVSKSIDEMRADVDSNVRIFALAFGIIDDDNDEKLCLREIDIFSEYLETLNNLIKEESSSDEGRREARENSSSPTRASRETFALVSRESLALERQGFQNITREVVRNGRSDGLTFKVENCPPAVDHDESKICSLSCNLESALASSVTEIDELYKDLLLEILKL